MKTKIEIIAWWALSAIVAVCIIGITVGKPTYERQVDRRLMWQINEMQHEEELTLCAEEDYQYIIGRLGAWDTAAVVIGDMEYVADSTADGYFLENGDWKLQIQILPETPTITHITIKKNCECANPSGSIWLDLEDFLVESRATWPRMILTLLLFVTVGLCSWFICKRHQHRKPAD